MKHKYNEWNDFELGLINLIKNIIYDIVKDL
jgi:hypothetical protein